MPGQCQYLIDTCVVKINMLVLDSVLRSHFYNYPVLQLQFYSYRVLQFSLLLQQKLCWKTNHSCHAHAEAALHNFFRLTSPGQHLQQLLFHTSKWPIACRTAVVFIIAVKSCGLNTHSKTKLQKSQKLFICQMFELAC